MINPWLRRTSLLVPTDANLESLLWPPLLLLHRDFHIFSTTTSYNFLALENMSVWLAVRKTFVFAESCASWSRLVGLGQCLSAGSCYINSLKSFWVLFVVAVVCFRRFWHMKSFPQYRNNLISVRTRSVMGRTSSLSAKNCLQDIAQWSNQKVLERRTTSQQRVCYSRGVEPGDL